MNSRTFALPIAMSLTLPVFAAVIAATLPASDPAGFETQTSCAAGYAAAEWRVPAVLGQDGLVSLDDITRRSERARAVFVGEQHDRPEHHHTQLELICRLYRAGADIAIGVEFFQTPFQHYVDDYVAGEIDERRLLQLTDYERRWGFPFELYAPILRFARDNDLPVVALNVPTELTKAVARRGLAGLTDAERAFVPDTLDGSDVAYTERLELVFQAHPGRARTPFQHFLEAQLLWDEGMAENAAEYLQKNPSRQMVVLAGNGHVAWRSAMPDRLSRRINASTVTISQTTLPGPVSLEDGDFLLVHSAPSNVRRVNHIVAD